MTVKLEITDLAGTPHSDIIKVAKFLLEFAGYTQQPSLEEQAAKMRAAAAEKEAMRVNNASVAAVAFAVPSVPPAAAAFAPPTTHGSPELDMDAKKLMAMVVPPAPAPPPPGIEVDASGMPWDVRIHSGSRAKLATGLWRQKRNTPPEEVARVEAELRTTMGLPTPAVAVPPLPAPTPWDVVPPAPPVVVPPVPAAVVPVPPPFVPSAEPLPPPAPSTPVPPIPQAGVVATASPSEAAVRPVTFPMLMQAITRAFTAKTLSQGDIQVACQSVGLPSLPMLASRPDLVAGVATALGIAL